MAKLPEIHVAQFHLRSSAMAPGGDPRGLRAAPAGGLRPRPQARPWRPGNGSTSSISGSVAIVNVRPSVSRMGRAESVLARIRGGGDSARARRGLWTSTPEIDLLLEEGNPVRLFEALLGSGRRGESGELKQHGNRYGLHCYARWSDTRPSLQTASK